jgi:GNAT superfamily N-acetyltransferase
MPSFNIIKEVKPKKSFRVASIIDKFDLQTEHIREQFQGNIDLNDEWQIGIIVGASGTGKTLIAKELFGDNYIENYSYNAETILDDFPKDLTISEITKTFNLVGFSTPPSWLKPYSVLSNGEKMRVDLARALLNENELIVFDEFTSVVDRQIAQFSCASISKSVRKTNKKFIAVSCHYDIIEWLQPDWIFDTNEMKFDYIRGQLQRPKIKFSIYERKGLWNIFRKYHYLNTSLNNSAKQFIGYVNNIPVAFCGVLHFPHPNVNNFKRITRLVVLPDYQGLSIGSQLLNFVADYFIKLKQRVIITTTTPALISMFIKSNHWKLKRTGRTGRTGMKSLDKTISGINRYTTSWEYN